MLNTFENIFAVQLFDLFKNLGNMHKKNLEPKVFPLSIVCKFCIEMIRSILYC